MSKIPSNRSIRGALTTLKKAGIIKHTQTYLSFCSMLIHVDNDLMSPKRSIKKRLPKIKKVL
jgi:hypothetical protein